jgi:hypothetical protein
MRPVLSRLQQVYRQARTDQMASQAATAAGIPEIHPVSLLTSDVAPATRLNLMVPALSERHVFGGIATALRCAGHLRAGFASVRIIVTDEGHGITPAPGAWYGRWPVLTPAPGQPVPDRADDHIVNGHPDFGRTLAVHAGDVFMATAWWTAHIAYPVLDWQDTTFGPQAGVPRRLLYLIQDYEPGFYAWSSRYALAEATYRHGERTLAVFNTQILADYFEREEYRFAVSHVLEPRLNPSLAAARARMTRFDKQRVILVYGRPSVERNAFGLIVAALRQWAQHYPQAAQWQVVSAGEAFEPIDLGAGCTLQPVGKLSLDDYAQQLAHSAIGISLMISPHPSYPPLEMAAFGVQVLTNVYANKDLSRISPQLVSLERVDPDTIALALTARCRAFDEGHAAMCVERDGLPWQGEFLTAGSELGDVPRLLEVWVSE